MYQIGIESYTDPTNRPYSLREDCFYKNPVEVAITPELEAVADQASALLVHEGFGPKGAQRLVAHIIYAAAAITQDCSTQEELEVKLQTYPDKENHINMTFAAAMTITPFLPHLAK